MPPGFDQCTLYVLLELISALLDILELVRGGAGVLRALLDFLIQRAQHLCENAELSGLATDKLPSGQEQLVALIERRQVLPKRLSLDRQVALNSTKLRFVLAQLRTSRIEHAIHDLLGGCGVPYCHRRGEHEHEEQISPHSFRDTIGSSHDIPPTA